MADEYDPFNYGFFGTGGTGSDSFYVLPGEGGGERADTGLTVPTDDSAIDPITGNPVDTKPGMPGIGFGMPGNFGTFLTDLQKGTGGLGGALKGIFGGKYGDVTQLAAFSGLSALLNKMLSQKPDPVGYQGGVPQYTVSRTQTPMAQQRPVSYESMTSKPGEAAATVMRPVPYRPGQGGITYFNPIQYIKTGRDLGAAAPTQQPTPAVMPPVEQQETISAAHGGYMPGGITMLAGGRYLRGAGDGVSDSIPAKFERSGQPARLADGEFVIDARTVSEIGNGSSEAGARKLYAMMDRVHKARKSAKRGKPSGADKYLPK